MNNADFSVIVPFHNAEKYIERCARALLSQNYPRDRYEILMIDNNSTDSSAEIAASFEGIRVLREPKQGSYAARNRGLAEAQGRIAAFTDPDCVPVNDWLARINAAMTRPEVGLVMGDRQFATDEGVLGMLAVYESKLAARVFSEPTMDSYYAYTNNMAVRMPILKKLGGFHEAERGSDSVFLRAAVREYGTSIVAYVPDASVRHLEISSIGEYLRKKTIYGRVNRDPAFATPRALPLSRRIQLALKSRPSGSSLATTIGFFFVLAAGAVQFEWERR
jgi:glycosyltransferase involved in cell wall biosynthesis